MVGKFTEHAEKLKRMYTADNGRIQGKGPWSKLPFFWFILFLSYKCTRRCKYCYTFNQVGEDNKMEMDDRTFGRLLEWIPEVWRANNIKVNAVSFLGGEPLLRTDRIRQLMDAIFKNTDGMPSNVYTNGDLVDAVNWDDLEDVNWFSVNITDISLPELSRRMKIIGTRSNTKGQTITATLDDENLARVLDIARFGLENGYRLRFYRNLFRGVDEEYKTRLLKKYHELCDLLEKYAVKGYKVHTTYLLDSLIPTWTADTSNFLCGKNIAAVYPDGGIGPCLRNQSFKTGTIFDPDPMSKLQNEAYHYNFAQPDIPEECGKCESRTVCQGGCPFDKLLLTGTRAGKSVVCRIHKEIIPRLRYLEPLKEEVKNKPAG